MTLRAVGESVPGMRRCTSRWRGFAPQLAASRPGGFTEGLDLVAGAGGRSGSASRRPDRDFHNSEIRSFAFPEIVLYCAHPASFGRGVARDRHDTRGGDAMAAMEPQRVVERCADERRCCGRKSVWSWRPEAGAQSGGDDPADVGGYQAGHRGEPAISVKSHRAGKAGRLGCTCGTCRLHFSQQAGRRRCAEYERQLGGGSPLSSLMTAKD